VPHVKAVPPSASIPTVITAVPPQHDRNGLHRRPGLRWQRGQQASPFTSPASNEASRVSKQQNVPHKRHGNPFRTSRRHNPFISPAHDACTQ
jgi:hypothetical protein